MRILEWCIEILLIFGYPFSTPLRLIVPLWSVNKNPIRDIPIVIVERWFSPNAMHIFLKRYLESQGYAVYMHNSSLIKGSFEDAAVDLKKFIHEKKLSNVTLVGISFGGISCLLYLEEQGGWKNVREFISVGTPFYGSYAAYALGIFKSVRQMVPNSRLVKKIKHISITYPKRIICLRTRLDEMAPFPNDALPGTIKRELEVAGHNYFHILSPKVFATIAKEAKD